MREMRSAERRISLMSKPHAGRQGSKRSSGRCCPNRNTAARTPRPYEGSTVPGDHAASAPVHPSISRREDSQTIGSSGRCSANARTRGACSRRVRIAQRMM